MAKQMTPEMKIYESALWYAKHGFKIFPLQGKAPLKDSHAAYDATDDVQQISKWWANGQAKYNIGLATGVLNGIVVLDVDIHPERGVHDDEILEELQKKHEDLPETWMALSGSGGIHYYFRSNDPDITVGEDFIKFYDDAGNVIQKGLDFRGNGGYIVLTPSSHPETGRSYEWEAAHRPVDLPLAPLPEWLRDYMLASQREKDKGKPPEKVPEKIKEGSRNGLLFKSACSLRARGYAEDEILATMLSVNQNRCDPPLPEREVKTIVKSASKYERGELPGEVQMEQEDKPTETPHPPALEVISMADLKEMDVKPPEFVVEGLFPVGLNVLASPPKYGKSWFAIQLSIAVSTGTPFLSWNTHKHDVLYMALEDSNSRLKKRMACINRGWPKGFRYTTRSADLDNGLIVQLEDHLTQFPDTKLIIIDTLAKVRGMIKNREVAYQADYREAGKLKAFAEDHGVCVLVITHLRKMKDDEDWINMITGTTGVVGSADNSYVLLREKREDATTHFRFTGRDVEETHIIVQLDKANFQWISMGDGDWFAEQQKRLKYDQDPVVITIKSLLARNQDGWSGTASDFLNQVLRITGMRPRIAPNKLGKAIRDISNDLWVYDGINYEAGGNGSGGGKHRFYRGTILGDLPNDTETPFDQITLNK